VSFSHAASLSMSYQTPTFTYSRSLLTNSRAVFCKLKVYEDVQSEWPIIWKEHKE